MRSKRFECGANYFFGRGGGLVVASVFMGAELIIPHQRQQQTNKQTYKHTKQRQSRVREMLSQSSPPPPKTPKTGRDAREKAILRDSGNDHVSQVSALNTPTVRQAAAHGNYVLCQQLREE